MNSRTTIGAIVLVAIGIIVIGAIWFFVLRSPEEASAPIEAVPLEIEATDTAEPTEAPPAEPEPTTAAAEGSEESSAEPPAAPEPTEEPTAEPEPTEEAAEEAGELRIYEISQEGSETRFILNEELAGVPTTVTGITDQVAGQIAANFSNLSTTQVGVIQVNARTLATDNNFRNNAIANRILLTNEYEFITFTPTSVNGLPESVEIGEEITFEIVGDLTIREITDEVTFSVTATPVSEEQITGTATTEVLRSDFDLQIPQVRDVANVTDEVTLEIDFVANVVDQ